MSSEEQPPGLSSVLHTEGYTCDHAFMSTQEPAQRCLCLINESASGPSLRQQEGAKTPTSATSVGMVVVVLVWFAVAGGGVAVGGSLGRLQLLPSGRPVCCVLQITSLSEQ